MHSTRLGPAAILLVAVVAGCRSPLERSLEQGLREQLITTNREYRQAVAAGPVIELSREPSDVEQKLPPERRAELDGLSGPDAYDQDTMKLGADLLGDRDPNTVAMSLNRAIQLSVRNNLDVQVARLVPAINQTQITQAEAVFDAVVFSNLDHQKLDTPLPPTVSLAAEPLFGAVKSETTSWTTGIRKRLSSGGVVTLQNEITRNERDPALFELNPYYDTNVLFSIEQPLLRNFGSDVNRAQILLNQNLRSQGVADLRTRLLDTIAATEEAYWNLVFARQQLLIQQRLLDRTISDRDRLEKRGGFDASPAQITQANSFVEQARANTIRARQDVRRTSDALKRLINAPDMSVASEALIVPLEKPADVPIQFSLLDAVTTALRVRPEIRDALLQISDASIRQRVADNLRLPQLNLRATVRFNGVGDETDEAYDMVDDFDFIDYLLRAEFEIPIGNRSAQALYDQRTIERRAFVIAYRNRAQIVVLEVKNALRDLIRDYELIGAARAARRSAADNLRVLDEQERAGEALTPEFVDRKLQAETRLANTETQEIQALTDYNTSISNLHRAMGTLLDRNGIVFDDPMDDPVHVD